ncbi:MAG TPA: hypothetical protein VFY29_06580 [Terriglobia bacterium]|nr:hypothetical protein [Terriglobia bacterium]
MNTRGLNEDDLFRGNTVVPALLTLERLGFDVSVERSDDRQFVRATREQEAYVADDPIEVRGLVKLIEIRGWEWKAADNEIEEARRRFGLF